MPMFWNPRRPLGRRVSPPPGPPAPHRRGRPAAAPAQAAPGRFGLPTCALTYAGKADTWTVFNALTRDVLGDAMVGDILGHPEDGSAILPMRSGMVVVMSINAQMPLPDQQDDLAQRAIWDGWRGRGARWRRHAIVGAFGTAASLEAARDAAAAVLKVAAILASTTDAEGVNWKGNPLFHRAADFVTHCQADAIPPQVVIHPQFYEAVGPDGRPGLGAVTRGMRMFGLPELDYLPGGEPGAVCNRLFNLSAYLLANGPVLGDGDTVGICGQVQGHVRHVRDHAGELMLSVAERRAGAG